MYQLKIVFQQRLGFALTVLGVALCAVLMLFLLAVYRGAELGSVAYVRSSDADLWVLQRHADNILRATSLLRARSARRLEAIEGVEAVAPVLFLLVSAQTPRGPATIYLTGFDPEAGAGGPPRIVRGANVAADDQIVLDHAFARKYGVAIGDRLLINRESLLVVGFSADTNMFVIQYAFTSLPTAHRIVGLQDVTSCFQVRLQDTADPAAVAAEIRSSLPGTAVYDRETFVANNIREMESGLLPLLFVVAAIAAVVLTAILSLILTVGVLDRRKDFAIMKAIGAPTGFLPSLIAGQALILASGGLLLGIALFFPLVFLVGRLAPEVSAATSPLHLAVVALGVVGISLVSIFLPFRRLRRIYPLEAFR